MKNTVFVIGGTGYVGEKVIEELKKHKYTPVILTREKHQKQTIIQNSNEIRIKGEAENIFQTKEILTHLKPIATIYLIGLIKESKPNQTFENAHFNWAVDALKLTKECKIQKFIYMSANGARQSGTKYQTTKFKFEQFLMQSSVNWTIVRPSLLVGKSTKYHFVSEVKKLLPLALIPIPTKASFAPVSRNDVAKIIVKSISSKQAARQIYQICGPGRYTFEQIVKKVARIYRKKVITIPFPEILFKTAAKLRIAPFTLDQITMLQEGNVCSDKTVWTKLNISPKKFEDVLAKEY